MMRKYYSILLAMGVILFMAGCGSPEEQKQQTQEKPNFVFILADDLGFKDLGCYGSSFHETPHIDALAAGGMKFTQGYAASPVCSPTRSSIMTGKNPGRTDNTDWFGAPQPDEVDDHWTAYKKLLPAPYQEKMALDETTLAEAFKEAGYSTFFAGKWHLGPESTYWPRQQGFDINKGGWRPGSPNTRGDANGYFSPYGNPRLEDGPEGEHLPQRLADETTNFIEDHQDQPFLAYLSFYSVHNPQQATDALKAKYQRRKEEMGLEVRWGREGSRKVRLVQSSPVYGGMVEAMDEAVGNVRAKLQALGLDENTIIIFMSDNGGLSTSEGHPTSNLPLRAGKGWMYEGGIREPWIIRWPGVTEAGSETDVPVISMDFYPTMLDMAGIPLKPGQHMDGESLVDLLKSPESPGLERDAIYWHYPHYGNQGGSPSSAIRKGPWKLIYKYEDESQELYNITEDISEENNLADQNPEKVQELQNQLDEWLEKVDAKKPSENPGYDPEKADRGEYADAS